MESPEQTAAEIRANLEIMKAGSVLKKAPSRMWRGQRHYRLLEDCKTIMYRSSWAVYSYSTFSVCDVEEVLEGHASQAFLGTGDEFPPERCFTLVFRGRRTNLDLVAESAEEARAWVQGVRALLENLQNMDESEKLDQWISDLFMTADKNNDGRISFKEVQRLLKIMNIEMNEQHANYLFTMADVNRTDTLDAEEFVHFYKMLTLRADVVELFHENSSDGQTLSHCDLEEFLRVEQMMGERSNELALDLIHRYEPSDTAKAHRVMSLDGFLMYLTSPEGSVFNPDLQGLHQDMSQPLNHYFVSSSHNTYLLDDQLKGRSSVEAYIKALRRGCRCLEVDCWDGSNGEPVVYHGHTFTSKILFRDVISTVAKHAFQASEYPLILSIENHCSIEQQTVMAQILREILGDVLLTTPIDGKSTDELPSPEELKGKILLKGKKIGGLEELPDVNNPDAGELSDEEKPVDTESMTKDSQKSKQSVSQDLSDLVVYCRSVRFNSFHHSLTHHKPSEMSSFSESKARKLTKEAGADFVGHNRKHLSRIYPSGLRTDSSNFCPQDFWNVGCQIVALNFQTAGVEMDLNDGLFGQNNRCGFVLKPEILRRPGLGFDPERPADRHDFSPLSLTIQVISGQQLPKVSKKECSIVDPLVRVEIYGVPQDQTQRETRYIENNGFNPRWNETLEFVLHTPELAAVRFVVEDYDKASRNDFMGQYTVPLSCVQPGYRHVHLLSRDGTNISPSSLFVNIKMKELSSAV